MAWSRDGRWLLWLSGDGVIHAWSPSGDAPVAVDGLGHVPPLTALAVGAG
jgi:hypothetical protein